MIKKTWWILGLTTMVLNFSHPALAITPGIWRFELKLGQGVVPFLIELEKNGKTFTGKLKNGKETIHLNNIVVNDDDISIPLDPYEVSLELNEDNKTLMQGHLVRHNKNPKVEVPVVGVLGPKTRFLKEPKKPTIDLTGKWKVEMKDMPEGISYKGVIIFKQEGTHLTGSILTPTGDYRYMEGYVSENGFEASSFDGVYNYLVQGTVTNDVLQASILTNLLTKIEGKKDNKAELPNAYGTTQLPSLNFSFPDLEGKPVSLDDKRFKGKAVVVQFFGSWCPNCIDEMNYFVPWYKKNHKRGVEIVALSFERSVDDVKAKIQLLKIQKKYGVTYPMLIAGITSDDKPMDKIKGLKDFSAFPTTVYLNRKHEVLKVHSGFTGPSTGEFFEKWKKEFNLNIKEILKK